jgi:hypothetical protein
MQYGEMFSITAIVCLVGAVLALFISGRKEHADEPASAPPVVDGDDSPAQMIDEPTQAIRGPAGQSPGSHRPPI